MKKKIILIYIFILFCNVYSKEFIKGADISLLIEMEKAGQKYYDKKGKEKDCIKILNENGIEWIRIRVWNKPYDVYWSDRVSTNKQKINGNIGGGTNDINKAITLAKRAKQYNMKILLDFHYSDFWADPGKQYKPDDWIGLKGVQLEKALYEYTKNSLIKMAKNNVLPDMVQIGNEINNGFIWRDGKDISSKEFINLLNSGIKAVKEVEKLYNKKIKIMLHLAFENDFSKLEYLLNRFKDNNLDYDILGLSYYPYWHGEMKNLYNNMLKIKNNYNKNVIIVETAYGYTLENFDNTNNAFWEESVKKSGFPATIKGQERFLRELIYYIKKVNFKISGLFYWEPEWIARDGAGWIKGEGNSWDNQTLFDKNGKVLESIKVFKRD